MRALILFFVTAGTGCISYPRPFVVTVPGPHQTINCGGAQAKGGCGLTKEERDLVLKRRAYVAKLKTEKKADRK